MIAWAGLASLLVSGPDMDYLRGLARQVVDSAIVRPGASIPGAGTNTTGEILRVPGGTQTYYPAFWVRDAAMMLGGDLVPAAEVKGWINVIAATQPGPEGLSFDQGLKIPGYSIPDHITLGGKACWFPGAYEDQGTGAYGHLPPADDAFYFIQMVDEAYRLEPNRAWLKSEVATGWGQHSVLEVAERALESVAVNPDTNLVTCDAGDATNRVDWGFCDSIRKSGQCLMPTLLRWQALRRLSHLCAEAGESSHAQKYRQTADQIQRNIPEVLYQSLGSKEGWLRSATGIGGQDDVWASAFAVWLHALSPSYERRVAAHLDRLYRSGGVVVDGQVRQVADGHWESALTGPDEYQSGGYWATPTGWFAAAIKQVDPPDAQRLITAYVAFVKANRDRGAPFEWIDAQGNGHNGNYGSSAGLVYLSLAAR